MLVSSVLWCVVGLCASFDAAHAYTQWEWEAVGIVSNPSGAIYFPGPGAQTTFATKEQALNAARGLHPDGYVLTKYTGARKASNGRIEYHYAAPAVDPILGAWRYSVSTFPCGTYSTEAALLACLENYYEVQVCDDGEDVTLTPAPTWTPGVINPGQEQYGTAQLSVPASCGTSPATIGIWRTRTNDCPDGYHYWNSPAPEGRCTNEFSAVVRGGPLECPVGSPSAIVGNPCNVATGDKSHAETDYSAPGLTFTRHYHSMVPGGDGGLGGGWSHGFSRRLVTRYGNPSIPQVLIRESGYQEIITGSSGSGRSTSGSGIQVTLVGSEWIVRLGDGSTEVYGVNGELLRVVDSAGHLTSLVYSPNSTGWVRELSSVVGPFGHRVDLSYEGGRLKTLTNSAGDEIHYGYDAADNLSTVTFPDGTTKEYLYEDPAFPNALTGIIDEAGTRTSTYEYDSIGRVTSSERSGGAGRVDITYNASDSIVEDALGLQTQYTFGAHSASQPRRITSIVRGGLTTQFQLEAGSQRRVTRQTDARGVVTTFSYDADHLTSKTEAYQTARQRTTSYEYRSTLDDLPTLITEPGRTTTFTYELNNGNVLSRTITDAISGASRTWTYTYYPNAQLHTADGPRTDVSDITTYSYYNCAVGHECGQVEAITNALGHVTTYGAYNEHGQPTSITDPNGVTTTLTYDARQRVTSRTVGSESTEFAYWPTGLLKRVTLPDDSYIEYTYDDAQRLTDISDADGNRIHYTLDAMGNRTGEQAYDPSNAPTHTRTRVFDTLSRLQKEIGAAGTANVTTTFGYDNNGNQTSIAAPLSRDTSQGYDELNRLISVTDPLSGVTQYGYNALDQLISVTDPNGLGTTYAYNALGDLLQLTSPDTGATVNTYDSGGNVATRTDARGASIGQGTYTYDALNRVTQIVYPDHTVTYEYDNCANGIGRLCAMSDASGSSSYDYDEQGRVTRKTQTVTLAPEYGTQTREVRYAYENDRLVRLRMPSGGYVHYSYDTAGRIVAVGLSGTESSVEQPLLSNVLYDPFGGIRGWTWANGTQAIREYDQDGRITTVDSAGLAQLSYDDANRITDITTDGSAPAWTYGYDLLDRLTSATRAGLNRSYTYDANGNRQTEGGTQSSTYSYSIPSTSNRLLGISGSLSRTYAYDAAGNVTDDGLMTLTYDGAGRMKSAGNTQYFHNGQGQRVLKRYWAGYEVGFVYDEAGHVIEKCVAWIQSQCNEWSSQQIVWLGDIPVAAILETAIYHPEGHILNKYLEVFNIHTDHLNTPRSLTRANASNERVWRWNSDPFGIGIADGSVAGGEHFYEFDLRLPGQVFDTESGLHYNYFRDYDPATGRYAQSDPIGLDGGINTYAYVRGNPVQFIDPFGLEESPTDGPAKKECTPAELRQGTCNANAPDPEKACEAAEARDRAAQEAATAAANGNIGEWVRATLREQNELYRYHQLIGQPIPGDRPQIPSNPPSGPPGTPTNAPGQRP